MQPILNLGNGELATPDTAISRAAPAADPAPSVFANVLGPRMLIQTPPPSLPGNQLPQPGNDLPVGPPALDALSERDRPGAVQSADRDGNQNGIQGDVRTGIQSDVRSSFSVDPEQIIASLHQQLSALQESSDAAPASGNGPSAAALEPADSVAAAVDPLLLNPPATDAVATLIVAPVVAQATAQTPVAAVATNAPGLTARRPAQNSGLLSARVSAGVDSLARDSRPDRASLDAARSTLDPADSVLKPLIPAVAGKAPEQSIIGAALDEPVNKPQFTVSAASGQLAPDVALTMQAPPARAAGEALLPSPLPTTTLNAVVQESGWGDAFAEKISLMANNKLQAAEIRLTPADLGPLRVRLTIEDGAASIAFSAQHAVTRDAIEQALPRLREMLAENGLSLERASVGEEGIAQGHRDDERHAQGGTDASLSDEPEPEFPPDMANDADRLRTWDGLVDTFV